MGFFVVFFRRGNNLCALNLVTHTPRHAHLANTKPFIMVSVGSPWGGLLGKKKALELEFYFICLLRSRLFVRSGTVGLSVCVREMKRPFMLWEAA